MRLRNRTVGPDASTVNAPISNAPTSSADVNGAVISETESDVTDPTRLKNRVVGSSSRTSSADVDDAVIPETESDITVTDREPPQPTTKPTAECLKCHRLLRNLGNIRDAVPFNQVAFLNMRDHTLQHIQKHVGSNSPVSSAYDEACISETESNITITYCLLPQPTTPATKFHKRDQLLRVRRNIRGRDRVKPVVHAAMLDRALQRYLLMTRDSKQIGSVGYLQPVTAHHDGQNHSMGREQEDDMMEVDEAEGDQKILSMTEVDNGEGDQNIQDTTKVDETMTANLYEPRSQESTTEVDEEVARRFMRPYYNTASQLEEMSSPESGLFYADADSKTPNFQKALAELKTEWSDYADMSDHNNDEMDVGLKQLPKRTTGILPFSSLKKFTEELKDIDEQYPPTQGSDEMDLEQLPKQPTGRSVKKYSEKELKDIHEQYPPTQEPDEMDVDLEQLPKQPTGKIPYFVLKQFTEKELKKIHKRYPPTQGSNEMDVDLKQLPKQPTGRLPSSSVKKYTEKELEKIHERDPHTQGPHDFWRASGHSNADDQAMNDQATVRGGANRPYISSGIGSGISLPSDVTPLDLPTPPLGRYIDFQPASPVSSIQPPSMASRSGSGLSTVSNITTLIPDPQMPTKPREPFAYLKSRKEDQDALDWSRFKGISAWLEGVEPHDEPGARLE